MADDPDEPVAAQSTDWEYEEAHDDLPQAETTAKAESAPAASTSGAPTDDSEGDYQYDLAHEIPKG